VVNDAASYAKSIAKKRGKNESWAEDAVRKSISTTAEEALEKNVIDLIAESTTDLLLKLDGRTIEKNKNKFTLHTKIATVVDRPMDFRTRLLSVISNPNITYILLMIGLAGLYFELSNPGLILPGIVGGISLILAFFAFQALPVNYAGIALILLAIILFIAEIKVPSFGLLSVGGVISLLLGSVLLFKVPGLYATISWGIVLPIALMFALFFIATVFLVIKVHRKPTLTGKEGLIGEIATVLEWNVDGTGKIFCHGEYWDATGPATLKQGDKVKVKNMEHLLLKVEMVESEK
jgi:membrane-bound serine protease (ClpP class)